MKDRNKYHAQYDVDHKERKLEYRKQPIVCKRKKEYDALYYENNRETRLQQSKINGKEFRANLKATGQRIIDWVRLKYTGIPCMDCGGVFPWCAMDFDHRPEETKEFAVSTKGWLKATPERLAQVEKEIAKCDVVCSNCHRIRTHLERPTKDTP